MFIICFSKNSLSLQIWNWGKVGDEEYRHVLEELCDIIREFNKKLSQNISYINKAKCHDGDYSKVVGRIRYDELTKRCEHGLYMCEEHRKKHTKNCIEETWSKHVDTLYWPDTMSESRQNIYEVNYMRPESGKPLVAAIDIGNTYSGYAFSFGNEFVNDPCHIASIGWIPASTKLITSKTPTSILLNQNKKFEAFGYEADDRYHALVDENLHHGWYYFKRFKMNLSGSMTGIQRENVVIVLEPEAASLFCKFKSVEREKNTLRSFQPGRRYIILDCGVQNDKTLKELYKASGESCGGIQVEEAFKDLIIKIASNQIFSKFSAYNTSDLLELLRKFEIQKRVCNRKATETVTIKIPVSLKETFEKESKETIQNVISKSQYSSKLILDNNKLRVNNILFASLFEGAAVRIVEHVKKFVKGPDVSETSSIIMVGGFSESQLLQTKLKKAFADVRVITPRDAELAVLTGAVIFGHLT
ncbi:unnamed protein product [Mytilus coruscus]|uniref:Uncharacterized protein n=1 Tax=Mytilus coruscus TaxID=42192 RepID=A0A6J8EQ67_MYTCO|nr:unnamed protein product [Mytilus coruscus]